MRRSSQVSGPLSGLMKPPTSQEGTSTATVPGTMIVNRIVLRIGPIARVMFKFFLGCRVRANPSTWHRAGSSIRLKDGSVQPDSIGVHSRRPKDKSANGFAARQPDPPYCKIESDGRESRRSFRVFQSGSP
jgi:hypothetical protein